MRRGILSDTYIKAANPEYFPLDIGSQQQFTSVTLPTHNLDHVKTSKPVCITTSRRPLIDLHNYASLAKPLESSKYEAQAITQYKQLIHNVLTHNQSPNLQTNFNKHNSLEVKGDEVNEQINEITSTQTEIFDTSTPSINLHYLSRKASTSLIRKEVGGNSHQMFSVRSRHMLSNLVDKEDYQALIDKIHPDNFNPKFKQMTDNEVLDKLLTIYPDDTETIQNIFDDTLVNDKGRQKHSRPTIDLTPEIEETDDLNFLSN